MSAYSLKYSGDRMMIVISPSVLTPTEKVLMSALAYHDGIKCCPSHTTLADETGLSRREIIRHLANIKDKGYMTWKRGRRASEYTIFYDRFTVGKSPTSGSVLDVGKSPTSGDILDVGNSGSLDVGKFPTLTGIEPESLTPPTPPCNKGGMVNKEKTKETRHT